MRIGRVSNRCAVFSALSLLFLVSSQGAEGGGWIFEGRPYYDPLIAGVREPQISALALARADRMAFMVSDKSPRRVWDIDLGAELPIAGWESTDVIGPIPKGEWGWGIWIPIDFHMIEDFVDESAPIINTDYRFGLMAKARRGCGNNRWLAARVFAGHESTHLGDEFSIRGQQHFPRSFERINVSWEYLDLGVLYEWHTEQHEKAVVWTLRGGTTMTLPFKDSYYSTGPGSVTESRVGPVTESTNWIDPYAGLEVTWDDLFKIVKGKVGYDLYLSSELRWRTIYDYHKRRPNAQEDRQASLNLLLGFKENGSGNGIGRASPFVRFYRGVNPHGQFRNQKDYTELGIGLRLAR